MGWLGIPAPCHWDRDCSVSPHCSVYQGLEVGLQWVPRGSPLPKCQSILWPFPPLPAALTAAASWALTAQGPGALRTPMGQTGVTSPSAPSPYLQHPYWEHALWLSCVSHRCLSSLSSSGRSLPSHHRAAKAGKDVTQVRAGVAVTPCSHGVKFGPPLADPLFASTAGVPFSVRLRGPFTRGASGGIQREGTQDLSHRQGEHCPGGVDRAASSAGVHGHREGALKEGWEMYIQLCVFRGTGGMGGLQQEGW